MDKIDKKNQEAIRILQQGGIIIYPTDTAFGIGCKVSDEQAVKRLFHLRRRSETKAVPLLIDSIEMTKKYVLTIPPEVKEKLMEQYWPGALTIVLPSNKRTVPALVRGGGDTIGMRMPNHIVILDIIKGVGEGIVGCSANFAGEKTPYVFGEIDPKLVNLVDYVVPGTTNLPKTSTVINCAVHPWKILRNGAIDLGEMYA